MWEGRHPSNRGHDPRLAHWSDHDLTWNLSGVIIESLVVWERELFLTYTAESGLAHGRSVNVVHLGPPGEDDVTLTLIVTMGETVITDSQFAEYVEAIESWRSTRERLRFCASPNRVSAFYASDDTYIPIPQFDPE